MNRYVKSSVKYNAELGMAFVDEITLIQTNFINSRTAQLNLKGGFIKTRQQMSVIVQRTHGKERKRQGQEQQQPRQHE